MLFFAQDRKIMALTALLLFMIGDKLDGYLARRLNQETSLGELLDNSADFLFIAGITTFLYFTQTLPALAFWLIASSGIFLAIVNILIFKKHGAMHSGMIDKLSGGIYFILFLLVYLPEAFRNMAWITVLSNTSIGIWRAHKLLWHPGKSNQEKKPYTIKKKQYV